MDDNFKLGIAEPSARAFEYARYHRSFTLLEKPNPFTYIVPFSETGDFPENIGNARNGIVTDALDQGCTHLLFMDTDQVYYDRDMIPRMMSHNLPVVGTVVHRRGEPYDPLVMRGEPDKYVFIPDEEVFSGEVIEVDATGMGCMLVKTEVFLDIPQPWFELVPGKDGHKTLGEDINFCWNLRQAGYRIFVDTSIKITHLMVFEVDELFYKVFKKLNKMK